MVCFCFFECAFICLNEALCFAIRLCLLKRTLTMFNCILIVKHREIVTVKRRAIVGYKFFRHAGMIIALIVLKRLSGGRCRHRNRARVL